MKKLCLIIKLHKGVSNKKTSGEEVFLFIYFTTCFFENHRRRHCVQDDLL
jgi:hypothetical protein